MAFPTPSEASSSLPVPTARPRPPSASAMSLQHMDRLSVDLHSSFALHINSPETSFDLLNDKISFFGQDGEETFDMEGVLRSIHEEEEKPSPLPRSESFMHDEPSPVGTALENIDIAPSSQAAFIAPQSSSISPTAPVFATPVPRQLSSTSDDKPTGPPALVPALKIVKRKRPDTTTLPSTAAPTTSCKRLQSPSLLLRVPSPDPPSVTSDPIRQAPTAVGRYVTEGPGPWRVPISNNDKEKVAATARNQKPTLGKELAVIDYDTLERILEINTLRIRPMGLRIFVEHPVDSAQWSKIRHWKHDNSLQSILVQKFFEDRRSAGVITRFDVRDGSDRRDDSDSHSLRAVGSRIVQGIHQRGETSTTTNRRSWFGTFVRRKPVPGKKDGTIPDPDQEDDADVGAPEESPPKQSTSLFGYLNPLALFSSAPAAAPESQNLVSLEEARAAEVENLRKRGWMPPGLARRQKSLRDRLRATEGRNPFLGGSKVHYRGKKKDSTGSQDAENPFADQAPDAEEITPQEVDEFFEVERSSSILELSNRPSRENKEKIWRLRGKSKKNKGKQTGKLGGGADIVRQPEDAFPDSPHHSRNNVSNVDGDDDE
ncbi:hypothetical protein B0H10DRAFT_2215387 [Mycena sp. CBHHK59/15]|nr:hypothetical protein B0H10DRAFT_2215387 [Mycena sp. CBHHK59/15]